MSFFIRTDLEKCSIKSLDHQWILCSGCWCESTIEDGLFYFRKHYYGLRTLFSLVLCLEMMVWSYEGFVWITMFLSAVWTLILTAPIHCRGSIAEDTFLQICSDEETNSSTSWIAWEWVDFQQISIFGWTIPLIMIDHNLLLRPLSSPHPKNFKQWDKILHVPCSQNTMFGNAGAPPGRL